MTPSDESAHSRGPRFEIRWLQSFTQQSETCLGIEEVQVSLQKMGMCESLAETVEYKEHLKPGTPRLQTHFLFHIHQLFILGSSSTEAAFSV